MVTHVKRVAVIRSKATPASNDIVVPYETPVFDKYENIFDEHYRALAVRLLNAELDRNARTFALYQQKHGAVTGIDAEKL